ncbi:phosphoglycerate dehydrogenase [Rariglobus hedericola]|uniref:3-phosphoglycerate dehydrogenase n=1 Tax=Rariglobus hedericola TaxID=2597822 RepID=A0A556QME9_9BACT|nr:phosphoglycerate dehydrogenase [Rariglobus hedericola]TSJ77830.1 3-phosphoglycerate dehydrogenase [Rariglobus hedericola]
MTRVLLTTTSFQDTPGIHHDMLAAAGFEIVRERGPLPESRMLELAGQFDAYLCGDDAMTRAVMEKSLPRLKVISKYGIGLDKINLKSAKDLALPVLFTPGVNHTTVAEHTFALLLAVVRNLVVEANHVAAGRWTRITGNEVCGKTLLLIGLGRIAKEVAVRARAFGLRVIVFANYWDEDFARWQGIERVSNLDDALRQADFVSLHTKLTAETKGLLDARRLALLPKGAVIVNTGRGELIDLDALVAAIKSGHIRYGADVLDQEPPPADHPLLGLPGTVITPHIGSRTHESVQRQASCAVENLTLFLAGKTPIARAV